MKKSFLLMFLLLMVGCDNAPEQTHQASDASQIDEGSMVNDDHSPVIALMSAFMMKDSEQMRLIWSDMSNDHKETARSEIEGFLQEMPDDMQASYSEVVKIIE